MDIATMERPLDKMETVNHSAPLPPVRIDRRTIDTVLVWLGVVAAAVLVIAGGLLMWGSTFASDYVGDELAAQNITFPSAEELAEEGRDDLVEYGDELVDTGAEAEAYAGFIGGHVDGIGGGLTYSELGGPLDEAKAAVTAATEAGASEAEIAELQGEVARITGQRDTVFKGEMLRGTLLNTFAWSTIGSIAGIASIVAFVAAGVTMVLVIAGAVHLRRLPKAARVR